VTAVAVLLVSIVISFVVVRIGAIAFELTGVRWDQAKFQALSAFTNSGFTTAESECVTGHPVRRRIASILIVLGNAGLVAVVGGFAGSLLNPRPSESLINVGVILASLALLTWLAHSGWFAKRLKRLAKSWLDRRYGLSDWSPQDLLHLDEGFALTRLVVPHESPALNYDLSALRLKQHTVQILAIERNGEFHPVPRGDDRLQAGDQIVVFGRAPEIDRLFEPEEAAALEVLETEDSLASSGAADRTSTSHPS
jgi:hypothetical protein